MEMLGKKADIIWMEAIMELEIHLLALMVKDMVDHQPKLITSN